MAKVNQIIALEKGIKSQTHSELSELYKIVQKQDLFNGFNKKYSPKDEEGDTKPPQSKRVQFQVQDVLRTVERSLSSLLEMTARKDWSNCSAKADIVVDEIALVEGVPVTYLLFLEKQMTDFRTFVANLPVLDSSEKWHFDEQSGFYKTEEIKTQSTSKEQHPIVLYDATPDHPAQTQLITKDVVVGYWADTKHSAAIPFPEKKELLKRVETLLQAIKMAREEANNIEEVSTPSVGNALFQYLMPQE
jgi:hypothetical protein